MEEDAKLGSHSGLRAMTYMTLIGLLSARPATDGSNARNFCKASQ